MLLSENSDCCTLRAFWDIKASTVQLLLPNSNCACKTKIFRFKYDRKLLK